MTNEAVTLDDLRRRINAIDDKLIGLIAERKQLSQEVARVKRSTGRATRDYEREREVIVAARTKAEALGVTDAILRDLALRRPPGVVFDVGSLKSPLRSGLLALKSHGVRVTSVHPMFGPDTELLSGRHVVFVDLGHAEALQKARELFG